MMVVNYDISPVYFIMNNHTGTVTGGLIYTIQQELAKIGGFDIVYSIVADPKGKSGLPYITSTLAHFDMLGVYYTDTTARRAKGIGFTAVCVLYIIYLSEFVWLTISIS